jgi:hypothetical protein
VMRAAKKAGHTGKNFGRTGGTKHRSTFGRGRQAAMALSRKKFSRRVVVMARIVRHQGKRFRAAPLARHAAYLERDGVTRDGRTRNCSIRAPTMRTPRRSLNAARTTGIISGLQFRRRTPPTWRTSAHSPGI